MSVFSGLSRLRNSFRKKSRVSETVKRNGGVLDDCSEAVVSSPEAVCDAVPSPKSGRAKLASPKTGRSFISSPKTGRASVSSPKTGRANISSPKTIRASLSSAKTDGEEAGQITLQSTSYSEISYLNSSFTARSLPTAHEILLPSSKNGLGERSPLTNGDGARTPELATCSTEGSGEYDLVADTVTVDEEVAAMMQLDDREPEHAPAAVNAHDSLCSGHSASKLNSNVSVRSSSTSTITATNRHSTDSCQDVLQAANHSVGNAQTRKSASSSEMDTFDSLLDMNELLSIMNKRASQIEITKPIIEMTQADEADDQRSVTDSTNAVKESDESYESLQTADAFDTPMDSLAHDLSFQDADEAENETRDVNGSNNPTQQVAVVSNFVPASPVKRTRSSNPNRVSFGANLQEVLGKAEVTRMHDSYKDKNTSHTIAPCEIPQTLKESSSTSILGAHKDPMEDFTCRVCNNLFRHPRILPCLHTFCTECIVNLQTYPVNMPDDPTPKEQAEDAREVLSPSPAQGSTSSSSFSQKSFSSHRSSDSSARNEDDRSRSGSDRVVLCPTCLRETRVSSTLDELPKNYVAERRVAQEECRLGGAGKLECDSCGHHSDSSVPLTVRCVDCAENLCSLCELSHRRQKKTKRHQLVDITSALTSTGRRSRSSSARRAAASDSSTNQKHGQSHVRPRQVFCSFHEEEELKLYCLTCDLPVCRDCVVVEHRDHDCQFLSQDLFRRQMSQVQTMIKAVVPRISAVDQQLKKVSDTQEQIRSRADEVLRDINVHMDSFLAAIEQHRQQLHEQVRVVVEEKQHALHVTERHLRHVRADVEQTCRFVSDMIENASDVEILSIKHLVTERLTGLRELSATQHQPVSSFMKFCPSERGQIINHFQMFGRVVSRKASAAASIIFSEGLSTARVSHESSVVLRVNSEDGTPYTGKDVQIKAWLIFQNQSIKSVPVRFSLQKNGTYSLQFVPVQNGAHFLHVAVDGQPVKDSPFRFKVKCQWREHRGLWHCCTMCSAAGRLDVPCACRGVMPGGHNQGCSHREPGHPGGPHWSCCAKMTQKSECSGLPMPSLSPVRQVTL